MNALPTTDPADLTRFRQDVDVIVDRFLAQKEQVTIVPHLPMFIDLLRALLSAGGKRLRPLLCYCGWQAAGGAPDTTAVLHAAASLEMFHAAVLIHDDVMDNSDTRRGQPTVHRALAAAHRDHPDAGRLGAYTAILAGDLALGWSYELLHATPLPPDRVASVWTLMDVMRCETMTGQYLDLLATRNPSTTLEQAMAVVCYKTAKYTVERPLHLGALLAGADQHLLDALSAFAIPIGEAFQLRDDFLGVYGDPAQTGKSRLDDLREGKSTVLMAIAYQRATPAQRHILETLVGDATLSEDGVAEVRGILTATAVPDAAESMITQRRRVALEALSVLSAPSTVIDTLRTLAHTVTTRTS